MDISGVSAGGAVSAALAQKEAYAQQDVQVNMFKKALDMQSQGAMALIDAIPSPDGRQGLPANLGNSINTSA